MENVLSSISGYGVYLNTSLHHIPSKIYAICIKIFRLFIDIVSSPAFTSAMITSFGYTRCDSPSNSPANPYVYSIGVLILFGILVKIVNAQKINEMLQETKKTLEIFKKNEHVKKFGHDSLANIHVFEETLNRLDQTHNFSSFLLNFFASPTKKNFSLQKLQQDINNRLKLYELTYRCHMRYYPMHDLNDLTKKGDFFFRILDYCLDHELGDPEKLLTMNTQSLLNLLNEHEISLQRAPNDADDALSDCEDPLDSVEAQISSTFEEDEVKLE